MTHKPLTAGPMTPAWCHCGLMWLTQGQHEITENDQTHMRAGCPRHNT